MNKSSIVFGNYDKSIMSKGKEDEYTDKIDETELSQISSCERESKYIDEQSQDDLTSLNKAHLDIHTKSRLGQSESESNFFNDEQSIKSNMLGSLMGRDKDQSDLSSYKRSDLNDATITESRGLYNQTEAEDIESIDNVQIPIGDSHTFGMLE